MAYPDPMDLSSPPRTPKPTPRSLRPSTPYKSNATVISLDSTPEPYDNIANRLTAEFLEFEPDYTTNNNDDDLPPDFTSPSRHRDNKIPPLKLFRPRTYIPEHHSSEEMQHAPQNLDHMSSSLPSTANPPEITIVLLLTPNPASLAETNDLESFATRFRADFSRRKYEEQQAWHSIHLYAHFRQWAARNPLSTGTTTAHPATINGAPGENVDVHVGIASIHPYALRANLEQAKEVNWRLALPVLKDLIDREVERDRRRFVVCGLRVGDVKSVRGFARKIAEPSGILAFSPAQTPAPVMESKLIEADVVPVEYMSRTLMINTTLLSQPQTYNALLAALYAKQLSKTSKRTDADAVNHSSARNSTFDDYGDNEEEERRFQEAFMMDRM